MTRAFHQCIQITRIALNRRHIRRCRSRDTFFAYAKGVQTYTHTHANRESTVVSHRLRRETVSVVRALLCACMPLMYLFSASIDELAGMPVRGNLYIYASALCNLCWYLAALCPRMNAPHVCVCCNNNVSVLVSLWPTSRGTVRVDQMPAQPLSAHAQIVFVLSIQDVPTQL